MFVLVVAVVVGHHLVDGQVRVAGVFRGLGNVRARCGVLQEGAAPARAGNAAVVVLHEVVLLVKAVVSIGGILVGKSVVEFKGLGSADLGRSVAA